jgi:glycosyltransferase involved in cell wall biosynthesis
MEPITKKNESEKTLVNKKIAVVNPMQDKFTDLYVRYFLQNNEVRLIKSKSEKDFNQVLKWADLVWSQWANEQLVAISEQRFNATLVTHLHSYEILVPEMINNVHWKRIDGIIFVSDHIRHNAKRLCTQQMQDVPQTTIYNCVELSEYPFRHVKPGKNIGYVGYINQKKGVGLLLQCIKAAVDYDPEFTFHIAGVFQETRFKVYMLHLIEEMRLKGNIVFHGWVKNIPDWLKSINYIISTSPWEGCPMNIIEAMACGIKPLIHNWQGAKTLFPEKYVFNTVGEFLALIKDPWYNSVEIRQVVEKSFNAKRNIGQIEKFLVDSIDFHKNKQVNNNSKSVLMTNS